MEKRNYPIERRQAPIWECPVCHKTLSSRGKIGHMEKVHGRVKPLKENCPRFCIDPMKRIKRLVSLRDMEKLIWYFNNLLSLCNEESNIIDKRKRLLQCEYVIRELEIRFNCTLEEVLKKFPELQQITEVKD